MKWGTFHRTKINRNEISQQGSKVNYQLLGGGIKEAEEKLQGGQAATTDRQTECQGQHLPILQGKVEFPITNWGPKQKSKYNKPKIINVLKINFLHLGTKYFY